MKSKQMDNNWSRFIFAQGLGELDSNKQRVLFFIWNSGALILSSAALCAVSLSFAIGRYEHLFYIYLGYLRTPEIFLLNWLPLLLLQLFCYALTNRQWIAFLLTGIVGMLMSVGNYFKLIFRNDPFTFSDLTSIQAGLAVAGEYDISIDWRILLSVVFMVAATLILFFFARARQEKVVSRVLLIVIALVSAWLLWDRVYTDHERYNDNAYKNFLFVTRDSRDYYVANGFYYPFLYSVTQSDAVPPEGYDENIAESIYFRYQNEAIPESKKVNIMILQMESLSDFESAGFDGISEEVYAPLRNLQKESYSGTMVANVIGGGTVVTERAVLTGSYREQKYSKPSYSYVWFLKNQGYYCSVSHPNVSSFYTRGTINEYLGFDEGYYLNNYFQDITDGEWRCDAEYLPEVFRLFREQAEGDNPVFFFNVSLQGHSPYNSESFDREDYLWTGENVSDSTRYTLNNYFSLIKETLQILENELEQVKDVSEPMMFLIYGDHKPLFSDKIYEELGISNSMESEQGMIDSFGTPYLIWSNDAAKKLFQCELEGDGPLVSPCYLMNLLFKQLGWRGSAFLQFTDSVQEHLPVICTKGGYVENGEYTQSLSDKGNDLLKEYLNVIYYLHYRPELAK